MMIRSVKNISEFTLKRFQKVNLWRIQRNSNTCKETEFCSDHEIIRITPYVILNTRYSILIFQNSRAEKTRHSPKVERLTSFDRFLLRIDVKDGKCVWGKDGKKTMTSQNCGPCYNWISLSLTTKVFATFSLTRLIFGLTNNLRSVLWFLLTTCTRTKQYICWLWFVDFVLFWRQGLRFLQILGYI